MRRFRIRLTLLPGLILGVSGLGMLALPVWAQSQTGGIQLRFGVNLGVEAQSNRTLDPADPGETVHTRANLSFGLLSETQQQSFAFNLAGTLRNMSGDGVPSSVSNGFTGPSASMNYSRSAATARLNLNASVSETDLADRDNLVFDEETGLFSITRGNAKQRRLNLGGNLNWRDDAPFGLGVLTRYEKNTYSGGVATGVGGASLSDSERLTFGVTTRLDLSEAAQLNSSLTYSMFDRDGVARDRETISLNNGLTLARPDGSMNASLGVTDTEDGTRISTSLGRSYEMPLTSFSGQIGVTRGVSGDYFMNGSLGVKRELPRGNLSLALVRSVSSDNEQDNEQVSTSLRLGYLHELSELANLNFSAYWAEAEANRTGLSTTNASFTASYSRAMTPDWNMDMGVRHRLRNDDAEGDTESNEVFLNLRREFLTRF